MSRERPKKPTQTGIAKARREAKRIEAENRQATYAAMTPSERVARLDALGFRAERERARLGATKAGD